MDNLEPITRNEMFLNGDDLEPITREEMILTGADLEPITRHEWFLKRYRGGGDVTIKRLTVTENGTYSESGKAYSPVVVNVPTPPIPENAYLLNSLSGLPADIASFNDGTDLPMASLKVTVTPYQDLSHGDPSPENICPIIGWDEAVVTVANDAESPTTSHEYTIDLDGTRYGGTLDVTNGELVVDRVYYTLDNIDGIVPGNTPEYNYFYKTIGVFGYVNPSLPSLSAEYKVESISSSNTIVGVRAVNSSVYNDARIIIRPNDVENYNLTTFNQELANNPIHIVFGIATPITVQLAPTPVKSLEGENNISANCGQITEGKYFKRA